MAYVWMTKMLDARGMNYDLRGHAIEYTGKTQNDYDWMMMECHEHLGVFQWQSVETTWADYARERGIRGWVRAMDKMYDWLWAGRDVLSAVEADDGGARYMRVKPVFIDLLDEIDAQLGREVMYEYWLFIRRDMLEPAA